MNRSPITSRLLPAAASGLASALLGVGIFLGGTAGLGHAQEGGRWSASAGTSSGAARVVWQQREEAPRSLDSSTGSDAPSNATTPRPTASRAPRSAGASSGISYDFVEVALFNTIDSPGLGDTDGLSVSLSKELGQNLFLTAALSDSSTESALFDVESSAISLGAGLRGSFSESLDLFASASWFTTSTTVDNWGWGGGAGLDANTNGMEYVLGARFMAAEQLELYAQLETLLPNDETFFDETDSIAIGGLYHASESLAFRLGLTRSESRSGGEAELLMLGLFWFF